MSIQIAAQSDVPYEKLGTFPAAPGSQDPGAVAEDRFLGRGA